MGINSSAFQAASCFPGVLQKYLSCTTLSKGKRHPCSLWPELGSSRCGKTLITYCSLCTKLALGFYCYQLEGREEELKCNAMRGPMTTRQLGNCSRTALVLCLITYRERIVNIRRCFLKKYIHLQQKVKRLSKPREQRGRGTLFSLAESTEGSSGATATSRCLWSSLSKQDPICNWMNWERPLTPGCIKDMFFRNIYKIHSNEDLSLAFVLRRKVAADSMVRPESSVSSLDQARLQHLATKVVPSATNKSAKMPF